jgi:hypothetical protein
MFCAKKRKTNSQFRVSGSMNSKIEVPGSRYPEKTKEQTYLQKMDPFLKVKKHCYSGDKISEFYDFGRKRKTTLDLKYQTFKIARGEKTGAAPTY